MKDILLMYARYTMKADASVAALLDGLSPEAREEGRKSYYGSLSGLVKHILDALIYFQGLIRDSCPAAAAPLSGAAGIAIPEGKLAPGQWEELKASLARADRATIDLIEALGEKELGHPVKLDWYDGKPDSVPLHFMANQLFVHGLHHRGQISQILDELGVEHDFSGIDLEFLPK